METATPLAPAIMLDTNALHNIASYLIQARRLDLHPYGEIAEGREIRNNLQTILHLPRQMADHLVNGLQALAYLQHEREHNDAIIYTSRLVLLELWNGLLDGRAHINMALAGIPYRRRQSKRNIAQLVRANLTADDFENVREELEGQDLEARFGIPVRFVEDRDGVESRDIFQVALRIQQIAFIDVADSYIYAAALAVLADQLITTDGELRTLINRIRAPETEEEEGSRALWQTAQQELLVELNILHIPPLPAEPFVEAVRPRDLPDHISELHLIEETP